MLWVHRRDSSQSGFSYTSSALLSAYYSVSTEYFCWLVVGLKNIAKLILSQRWKYRDKNGQHLQCFCTTDIHNIAWLVTCEQNIFLMTITIYWTTHCFSALYCVFCRCKLRIPRLSFCPAPSARPQAKFLHFNPLGRSQLGIFHRSILLK